MPSAGISGFRVTGLNAVVRQLSALGLDIDDLKESFAAVANRGAELAAALAPKRSGDLSKSIRGNKAKNRALVFAGRVGTPYAGAINYGWPARHIQGAGFMQQADEQLRPYAIAHFQSEINRKITEKGLG